MDDVDLDGRLAASAERLASMAGELVARAPWPLATRFDHAPETVWGPPEILAHLEEMLAFWLGEAERILDSADEAPPFGRAATDDVRLAVIGRDRGLPIRELIARTLVGIERWRRRWPELDEASRSRTGTHPRLGVMTVADVAVRFTAGHLEEHLDQLAEALGDAPRA